MGIYIYFSKKDKNHILSSYILFVFGCTMFSLYWLRTSDIFLFKGVYTQEILLFTGTISWFLAFYFGLYHSLLKLLNLFLFVFHIPFIHQIIYLIIFAITGSRVYDDETVIYDSKKFLLQTQTVAPGIGMRQKIERVNTRSWLTETRQTVGFISRINHLKFNELNGELQIKDTEQDTLIVIHY
jgi:hypothetical protein